VRSATIETSGTAFAGVMRADPEADRRPLPGVDAERETVFGGVGGNLVVEVEAARRIGRDGTQIDRRVAVAQIGADAITRERAGAATVGRRRGTR
jgi:hypothetical protein